MYAKIASIEPSLGPFWSGTLPPDWPPVVAAHEPVVEDRVPGSRVQAIEGSHLLGTEHRLGPFRRTRIGILPGQAVVLFESASGLVLGAIPCEDGHA